jgi:hypothetical protein
MTEKIVNTLMVLLEHQNRRMVTLKILVDSLTFYGYFLSIVPTKSRITKKVVDKEDTVVEEVFKTPTKAQKTPTKAQKTPTKAQKTPTKAQKTPTKAQKTPTKAQKTPTKSPAKKRARVVAK